MSPKIFFFKKFFAQKILTPKIFTQTKFFTQIARLSFVDLRWAQLYVSLVDLLIYKTNLWAPTCYKLSSILAHHLTRLAETLIISGPHMLSHTHEFTFHFHLSLFTCSCHFHVSRSNVKCLFSPSLFTLIFIFKF